MQQPRRKQRESRSFSHTTMNRTTGTSSEPEKHQHEASQEHPGRHKNLKHRLWLWLWLWWWWWLWWLWWLWWFVDTTARGHAPLLGNTGSQTPRCSLHCAIRSTIPRRAKAQSVPTKPQPHTNARFPRDSINVQLLKSTTNVATPTRPMMRKTWVCHLHHHQQSRRQTIADVDDERGHSGTSKTCRAQQRACKRRDRNCNCGKPQFSARLDHHPGSSTTCATGTSITVSSNRGISWSQGPWGSVSA